MLIFHPHAQRARTTMVLLPATSFHSYDQMIRELAHAFYCYNQKSLTKKFLELWKAPDESHMQFWTRFCNLLFQIPGDEIDWNFLMKYFSIFFTHLKIHKYYNHLNPSQHTSVLKLPNLRRKRSLSQVTICPHLIEQLWLRNVSGRRCAHIC